MQNYMEIDYSMRQLAFIVINRVHNNPLKRYSKFGVGHNMAICTRDRIKGGNALNLFTHILN